MTSTGVTIYDLQAYPEGDGNRYEIIDGELVVSTQPHWKHQLVSTKINRILDIWNTQMNADFVLDAPGIILSPSNAVAPDVVWISKGRSATAFMPDDGKLHTAPELVIEILSPGTTNEKRDREDKLAVYSRFGVDEYWIVSWPKRSIDVYSRSANGAGLSLSQTVTESDTLTSPVLPGFTCAVAQIFASLP